MNKIDQSLFSYRCHVDTRGRPIEYGGAEWRFDIKNLKRVMSGIDNYFCALDFHLSCLIGSC
ncbi:MAG: hypothetical protein FWG80_00590 [Alphaproteobacteria bacterium]|nr:hypothetical protein [Alphaproteobacteria bacterium]